MKTPDFSNSSGMIILKDCKYAVDVGFHTTYMPLQVDFINSEMDLKAKLPGRKNTMDLETGPAVDLTELVVNSTQNHKPSL